MAQQPFGLGELPGLDEPADGRRADVGAPDVALIDPDDSEPQCGDRIAVDPVVAEAVVVARDERLGPEAADQVVQDKLPAGQGAECLVERNDDDMIDAQAFEQRNLLVERSEQLQPPARPSVMRGCGSNVTTMLSPPCA